MNKIVMSVVAGLAFLSLSLVSGAAYATCGGNGWCNSRPDSGAKIVKTIRRCERNFDRSPARTSTSVWGPQSCNMASFQAKQNGVCRLTAVCWMTSKYASRSTSVAQDGWKPGKFRRLHNCDGTLKLDSC